MVAIVVAYNLRYAIGIERGTSESVNRNLSTSAIPNCNDGRSPCIPRNVRELEFLRGSSKYATLPAALPQSHSFVNSHPAPPTGNSALRDSSRSPLYRLSARVYRFPSPLHDPSWKGDLAARTLLRVARLRSPEIDYTEGALDALIDLEDHRVDKTSVRADSNRNRQNLL